MSRHRRQQRKRMRRSVTLSARLTGRVRWLHGAAALRRVLGFQALTQEQRDANLEANIADWIDS